MRLKFDWNGMEREQEPYLTLPDLTSPYLTTFTLPCLTLSIYLSIYLPTYLKYLKNLPN